MREKWPGITLISILLAGWEVLVRSGMIDTPSLPPVSLIFIAWYQAVISGELIGHLLPSLQRIAIGYSLAIAVAVPLGLLMGSIKLVYSLFEPLTELIRPIPSAAYVPVAILFFGIGNEMKVFVIFLACLWPVLLNTYGAVRGIDPVLVETGRTFGYSHAKVLRKVVFPSILPEIFTGMRVSLGIALIVVVVAEMIAGNNGIGYFILDRQRFFRVAAMIAGIFTLGIVGYALNWVFLRFEGYVLRWRQTSGS